MIRLVLRAGVLAVLAYATCSWAQVIYKSTMPDGRVIYGAEPAPGAKSVETMKPRTDTAGVRPLRPNDEKVLQQRETQRERQTTHETELQQAEQAVRDAEAAQSSGKEPLPGERLGTAGGASRLTDEYWARQDALATAVADARKHLNELRGTSR